MRIKTIKEILEEYDFELDRILENIKDKKAKMVLLQFPDGLKPYSTVIVDYLKEQTKNKVEFLIWIETCYGACDIPVLPQKIEKQVDLTIQFGHNSLQPSH
ncbi:MAG: diphthamide synthesis protein [archaeon]|nr:diphthamide synthesis protein [archaeon]